eukprot:2786364-Amphidinium_carterae.1
MEPRCMGSLISWGAWSNFAARPLLRFSRNVGDKWFDCGIRDSGGPYVMCVPSASEAVVAQTVATAGFWFNINVF